MMIASEAASSRPSLNPRLLSVFLHNTSSVFLQNIPTKPQLPPAHEESEVKEDIHLSFFHS